MEYVLSALLIGGFIAFIVHKLRRRDRARGHGPALPPKSQDGHEP